MSLLKEANDCFKNENYMTAYKLYQQAKAEYGFDFLDFNIEMCRKRIDNNKLLLNTVAVTRLLDETKTIDIILPIYNALEDVKNCINSLYEHKTYNFNLIAIDDCSDAETKKYLEDEATIKGFRLLRNKENLRFTKTVNRGFKESKGDYVVLLNSDTIVTPRWIEKILSCFESDSKIGIVGPLSNAASWQTVPVRDDKEFGGWLVNEIPKGYSVEDMGMLVETISKKLYPSVPSVNGFCYVIKREVLDKNGTLDEEYFPTGYGEEDDFSIRAIDAGFKIVVADDTYIFHAKSKSYTHEIRQVLSVKGRKALNAKHGKERLEKLVNNWKAEPTLPKIAKSIKAYMQISKGNKKVVYTAIFGNYDSIKEPEYINEDWDYICYTNNKNLKSEIFTVKYVDAIFDNQTKNARMIKLLSHVFLIGYDYSLWIDGSVKLRGHNINDLIDTNLKNNYISLHKHVKRDCIYEEKTACLIARKDDESIMQEQMAFYKTQGMPEAYSLFETAEIIRNQNNKNTKKLNTLWWNELNRFSIRDQLSLPYVFWKNTFEHFIMEGNQWIDKYFHMYKHKNTLTPDSVPIAVIMIIQNKKSNIEQSVNELIAKTKYKKYKLILANNTGDTEVDRKLDILEKKYKQIDILIIRKKMNLVQTYNYIAMKREEEFICFIDDSIKILDSGWLSVLYTEIIEKPDIAIVGPTVLNKDYSFLASSVKLKIRDQKLLDFSNNRKLGGTGYVKALHESCLLINSNHFKSIGMLSENFESKKISMLDLYFKFLEKKLKIKFVVNSEVIIDEINNVNTYLEEKQILFLKWNKNKVFL